MDSSLVRTEPVRPGSGCCTSDFRQRLAADSDGSIQAMFAALADPSQRAMLMRVLHEGRLSTCVPVVPAGGEPTAEHQLLEALRAAGLVTRVAPRRRRWACYAPVPEAVVRLRCLLDLPEGSELVP